MRAALLAVALIAPLSALADEASDRAAALATANKAAEDYKAGRYTLALQKFTDAYTTFPTPSLLSNLSHTEFKLGRCDIAVEHARRYATSQAAGTEAGKAADAWLKSVNADCPEVNVQTSPPHASFTFEGDATSAPHETPWTGRLPAGAYTIVIRHEGYLPKRDVLNVASGLPLQVTLTLVSALPPSEAPIQPPEERGAVPDQAPNQTAPDQPAADQGLAPPQVDLRPVPKRSLDKTVPPARTAGWVMFAIGGAGVLTGAIVGITALVDKAALAKPDSTRGSMEVTQDIKSINQRGSASAILLGVGGAVGITGISVALSF